MSDRNLSSLDDLDDESGVAGASASRPSKSQQKRAHQALQALAAELAALSSAQRQRLDLPEEVAVLVARASTLPASGARRRELKHLANHLQRLDLAPIQQRLAAWQQTSAQATYAHQQLERWRERLLSDETALTAFLREYPHADARHLRQLIRQGRVERAPDATTNKAARALFRYLRDIVEHTSAG